MKKMWAVVVEKYSESRYFVFVKTIYEGTAFGQSAFNQYHYWEFYTTKKAADERARVLNVECIKRQISAFSENTVVS